MPKIVKSSTESPLKLKVILEYKGERPKCQHGPALLFGQFSQNNQLEKQFFACSACRDAELCPLLTEEEYQRHQAKIEKACQNPNSRIRFFCRKCGLILAKATCFRHASHPVEEASPTSYLAPLGNDKTEAQYFFSPQTLEFFKSMLQDVGITSVLCIGAPALHDFLCLNGFKSFLMDIDERLFSLYSPDRFAPYNMFNHHFFTSISKKFYLEFLQSNEDLVVFTDPPFGCRTEPLYATLEEISADYRGFWGRVLPKIWVFPYFMENYIQQVMPELQMSDFKVNYTNHETYNETSKARKDLGSPVRFFTNIHQSLIKLPASEYRLCKTCQRYVALSNKHCSYCGTCPSKNGATYVHCKLCRMCVKPSFRHCERCQRCTLKSHDCKIFQRNVRCHVCGLKGHVEARCGKRSRKGMGNCWVCGRNGHVVQNCPERL